MLKFLLILLVVFLLLRMMGRVIIVRAFRNMQQRQPQVPQRPEGHITIEGNEKIRKGRDAQGDYVDYEEVK